MLLGVGGFIVLVMVTSMTWSAVEQALAERIELVPWFHWVTSSWINLLLNWMAFTMIYRVVPKVFVRWWEAARGGFLAAVLWELGRQALGAYLLHLNYPRRVWDYRVVLGRDVVGVLCGACDLVWGGVCARDWGGAAAADGAAVGGVRGRGKIARPLRCHWHPRARRSGVLLAEGVAVGGDGGEDQEG